MEVIDGSTCRSCASVAKVAVRMDRLSTFGQSADRPLVARQGALSVTFSGRPSPDRPRVLPAVLPCNDHGRANETGHGGQRVRRGKPVGLGLLFATALLIVCIAVAFAIGRFPVSLPELAQLLLSKLTGAPSGLSPAVETVILQIRGPRILAAVLTGSALAIAGAAFQGLFRNPLVSPDILGASSGAALGAVLGIFLSLDVIAIEAMAFAGGGAAVAAVYLIWSALRGNDTVLSLVLTGVVVGSLLGACVGLVKYLADPYNQLPAITFWLLGSLSAIGPYDLLPLAVPVLVGSFVLVALRWRMNEMSLPEEEARALGVPTH